MEQHALSICPHAKQHRHGLINRQTCKPVIGETPRGESRDRYADRVGQLLTQVMEYSTIKRAFGRFSVKVYLYSRDGGSTTYGRNLFHNSHALARSERWRRELVDFNAYDRNEYCCRRDLEWLQPRTCHNAVLV